MNIDNKKIRPLLLKSAKYLKTYAGFIFIIAVLLIYTFLVFRINRLSESQPTDTEISNTSIKRLKIDENAVEKLEQLEDQNIGVQSLFEEARVNPFQE